MKVLVALALCGLAAVVYAVTEAQPEVPVDFAFAPQCPPPVAGGDVILIGNPENCTTYYVCNSGIPVAMLCPAGLHFNDKEKVCDWPISACCDPAYDPEHKCNKTE